MGVISKQTKRDAQKEALMTDQCKSTSQKEKKNPESSKNDLKKIIMTFTDLYCSRCSLQFDKKSIFDIHLSIVHKESAKIKEESLNLELELDLGTEKVLMIC